MSLRGRLTKQMYSAEGPYAELKLVEPNGDEVWVRCLVRNEGAEIYGQSDQLEFLSQKYGGAAVYQAARSTVLGGGPWLPREGSQICCTRKLLKEMGVKGTPAPPETDLHPLATWYGNLFYAAGRKCVVFYNPATGYSVLCGALLRKDIQSLGQVLQVRLEETLSADGFSQPTKEAIVGRLSSPVIRRTADRRTLGHVNDVVRCSRTTLSGPPEEMKWREEKISLEISNGPFAPGLTNGTENLKRLLSRTATLAE